MKKILCLTFVLLIFALLTSGCTHSPDKMGNKDIMLNWPVPDIRNMDKHWDFDEDRIGHFKDRGAERMEIPLEVMINRDILITGYATQYLQTEAERLELEGEDVSDLNEMIDEMNTLLDRAKENRDIALGSGTNNVTNITPEDKQAYLSSSAEYLRSIHRLMPQIFNNQKIMKPGQVLLKRNDTLVANGNGMGILSGNFEAELFAQNARIVIRDESGDSSITTDAEYIFIKGLHPEESNYKDFTGALGINGTSAMVMVRGDNISFNVHGEGFALLTGDGVYSQKINNETILKKWPKEIKL